MDINSHAMPQICYMIILDISSCHMLATKSVIDPYTFTFHLFASTPKITLYTIQLSSIFYI